MSELIDELLADAARADGQVGRAPPAASSARSAPGAPPRAAGPRSRSTTTARTTPLKQLATISAPEARLLTITPYDKSSIKAIEKAILESDVGLTPTNDGNADPPRRSPS